VVSRSFVFAVPGDLATPTGGYAYDRRMIAELADLGWRADVLDLGSGFPRPGPACRAAARALLAAVPEGRCIVIDGLALGVLPEVAAGLRLTHRLIALVHHPLALETGLTAAEAAALRASERAALAEMRHVIVTSAATARHLVADYGVAADRVTVAMPGVDAVQASRGSRDGTVALLSVGALVPRKGYDVLIAALAKMPDLPWRLTIVGDRNREPATAARLDADLAAARLDRRVTFTGAVPSDRLSALYAAADLFVLASRHEGYGMAFAEAIAHGVPVVGTRAGAIPDTVPDGTGILVPPDDVAALAGALRALIAEPDARGRLAAAARAAARRLPTWPQSAKTFSQVLEAVA
jgi:glycosyltransferase involved in cell wall biosynthesis